VDYRIKRLNSVEADGLSRFGIDSTGLNVLGSSLMTAVLTRVCVLA